MGEFFKVSFFILGLHYLFTPEHNTPLSWIGRLALKYQIPEWILKPTMTCVVCMASVWGTLFYVHANESYSWYEWIVTIVVIAGINRVLKSFL